MCHVERMIGSLHSDLYRAIHLPLLPMLLYVQSMLPRWLSLSSCFYLVDNFARVNITQLHKYHASPYTAGGGGGGTAIKRKPNRWKRRVGWKYRTRFSDLSSASTRFNLRSQISCRNTGWRNATVAICPFCFWPPASYPLSLRSFC